MKNSPRRTGLIAFGVAVIAASITTTPAHANDDPAGVDPKASDVLDKYVEAVGGRQAHAALKTRVTKTKIDFKSMGFKAEATYFLARPHNSLVRMTGEPIGTFRQGVFGDVAWEFSSTGGARVKQGIERAAALREASMDGLVRWREVYAKAQHAGSAVIGDSDCHKIVLTPKEGHPESYYFDKESSLLVKSEQTIEHPVGQLRAAIFPEDYRRVDGVLLPFRMRMRLPGDERMNTTLSVRHNIEFPDDLFALPDEVEALTGGDQEPDPMSDGEEAHTP